MMLSQIFAPKTLNSKIVKIQLGCKNQLKIQWNFNGMLMPKIFRRHIFICLSNKQKQIQKAYQTMQNCFQFFKFGDLYTSALMDTKKLSWQEKTKIDHFRSLFGNNIKQKFDFSNECNLKNQLLSLSKYREPSFVVLFCDPQHETAIIQKFIKNLRQNQKVSCLVFLISQSYAENNFDFSTGICRVVAQKARNSIFQNIYKFYNDRLACLQAQITFQSTNGDIFIEQGTWKPRSFTCFSRKIYYPLANYFCDVVETERLYSQGVNSWNFKIKLEYKLLNGETFHATKEMRVPLEPDIDKRTTYNQDYHREMRYQLYIGIQLENNPFWKVSSLEKGIKSNIV